MQVVDRVVGRRTELSPNERIGSSQRNPHLEHFSTGRHRLISVPSFSPATHRIHIQLRYGPVAHVCW